ncbi:flagellar hook capping FlgD N-terminal domain-containing protein [Arthrobacter sp. ES3-54]|jgi:flagellar basal-body rod modification protein FlgD|uniref:flagellar hook assembly protein FlgD n=1 Tax=Arthrobacter sp. ES3-54 TaxID=1502991 RepID=UPI0024071310|nr:flagellar hook capping FlgD N-terminal domain-containing protein [Arthrobacter sp. ES3-54]MDF9752640.1 flagellar basal-body rod modification protein FlgD [Arthrobacter sp. ES3-54]
MTIQPIASQPVTAAGEASQASAVRTPSQSMDANVFMSLLVTQLKNQNPSAPMDTNQMMSQTLQLSMMEKMTELTTNSKEGFSLQMRTAAAQLIGHSVGYTLADGTTGTGIASSVSYAGSVPSVMIGDLAVPLDSVTGLTAPAAS